MWPYTARLYAAAERSGHPKSDAIQEESQPFHGHALPGRCHVEEISRQVEGAIGLDLPTPELRDQTFECHVRRRSRRDHGDVANHIATQR